MHSSFRDEDALDKVRWSERGDRIRVDCVGREQLIYCLVYDEVTQFPVTANQRC